MRRNKNSAGRDLLDEWLHLYGQMDAIDRIFRIRLIYSRLHHSKSKGLRQHFPRLRQTPHPIRLPVFHALLSFACLGLMPHHPIAIPTVLGIALTGVIYIKLLAQRLGYHLDKDKPEEFN